MRGLAAAGPVINSTGHPGFESPKCGLRLQGQDELDSFGVGETSRYGFLGVSSEQI